MATHGIAFTTSRRVTPGCSEPLNRTSTDHAPWHVIATDDKQRARLSGLEIVANQVGKGVDASPLPLDPQIVSAARKLWGWEPGDSDHGESKHGKGNKKRKKHGRKK